MAECETARRYRVRRPQATPLYRLVEAHYDEVKGGWEERYQERYGFWRGFVDGVVFRYLDCGVFSAGNVVTDCVPPSVNGADCHRSQAAPPA